MLGHPDAGDGVVGSVVDLPVVPAGGSRPGPTHRSPRPGCAKRSPSAALEVPELITRIGAAGPETGGRTHRASVRRGVDDVAEPVVAERDRGYRG